MKLIVPRNRDYRKVLGVLSKKSAMNLKCGACNSCASACRCK